MTIPALAKRRVPKRVAVARRLARPVAGRWRVPKRVSAVGRLAQTVAGRWRFPKRVAGTRCSSALCLVAFIGCASSAEPPLPGTSRGVPPDLTDQRVMVLPFQRVVAVEGDPDAELAFALGERGAYVTWVLPDEIDVVLARSPGMEARTRGLPVDQFLVAEVRRVGDPLYGYLRRMAAIVSADLALIPVLVAGVAGAEGGASVRVHSALVDVRSGRVLWFSIEEGSAFPNGSPRALASAMDGVASALVR